MRMAAAIERDRMTSNVNSIQASKVRAYNGPPEQTLTKHNTVGIDGGKKVKAGGPGSGPQGGRTPNAMHDVLSKHGFGFRGAANGKIGFDHYQRGSLADTKHDNVFVNTDGSWNHTEVDHTNFNEKHLGRGTGPKALKSYLSK